MIHWYSHLYMDEEMAKKPKKYKKRIESTRLYPKNIILITLASNEKNVFDIIKSHELWFQYHQRRDIYVIGMAGTYDAALTLLTDIVAEVWMEDTTRKIRECFQKEDFESR